ERVGGARRPRRGGSLVFPAVHGVVSQGGKGAAPEPPVGYRFHRLRFLGNNGRNTINIAEVQLRQTIGGPNAATGGAASASSVFARPSSESWPASQAFDSNPDTYWSSLPIGGRRSSGIGPGAFASSEFA